MKANSRLAQFTTTVFTEMTELANKFQAINLAQGFPDFDGPDFVKQAAIDAISGGQNQYARSPGALNLAHAVAAQVAQDYGLNYAPSSEVTIGVGVTELIYAALQALCNPGDEVILIEPYYDSYRAAAVLAGAEVKTVALRFPDFKLDAQELEAAFSERTKAILINTPHNPTGRVFSRAELELIANLCRKFDVACISDEVYEKLVYEGEHVPMASLPGMQERTITLSGLGKTFSLTGFRVGWALAPAELTKNLRLVHQFVTFAAPTPFQAAACAALAAPPSYFTELRASFRARRDVLSAALRELGFEVPVSQGSYFVCAGIDKFGAENDVQFCRFLTEKIGVAAIPPSAFYTRKALGQRFVRFVICKRDETIARAIERLRAGLAHH